MDLISILDNSVHKLDSVEKESWWRRDSDLGLLGRKQECFLCATQPVSPYQQQQQQRQQQRQQQQWKQQQQMSKTFLSQRTLKRWSQGKPSQGKKRQDETSGLWLFPELDRSETRDSKMMESDAKPSKQFRKQTRKKWQKEAGKVFQGRKLWVEKLGGFKTFTSQLSSQLVSETGWYDELRGAIE